jgi:beta-lactamase class A
VRADELTRRLDAVEGRIGVVVEDAEGRTLFERDPEGEYPAASVIKLPLVMALFAEAARGAVDLRETLPIGARVDGSGVLLHLRDVVSLTLRDLATLTVVVSDNTATNRLIDRLGFDVVNRHLDRWGCSRSHLGRRMYDHDAKAKGIQNVMTPRETARMMALLVRGELVDRATSDAVLEVLHGTQDGSRLRRYLPKDAWTANKSGWDERMRNDVAVVRASGAVVAAAFACDLASEPAGDAALGAIGWFSYRAAGGEAPAPAEMA